MDSRASAPSLGLFAIGLHHLHGRSAQGAHRLTVRARLFGGGWLILAAALISPLHEAGERSFAAHMFEHELIMLAAAPLLVCPNRWRSCYGRSLPAAAGPSAR